jgi:NAD(P)H-hydrate epimerase
MTNRTLTRDQARELDARATSQFGVPSIVLMENAGRGVTDVLVELGATSPVVICCGKGNNAGDGFVIARHLDLRGIEARVLVWANPAELRGDAQINFQILQKAEIEVVPCTGEAGQRRAQQHCAGASWLVDALLGTGVVGAPRPPLDAAIDLINGQSAPVLSVDLPSGLDCDTGHCDGVVVRAAHTCTFVAAKPGFFAEGAAELTGQLHVLDIGAPRRLVADMLGE